MTAATLPIEIYSPQPDCHLQLRAGEVDVNLGVSSIAVISGVIPADSPLAAQVWEQIDCLSLEEIDDMDEAVIAELHEALMKAVAPFAPMIRKAVMSWVGMAQDGYRDVFADECAKPIPVPVLVDASAPSDG